MASDQRENKGPLGAPSSRSAAASRLWLAILRWSLAGMVFMVALVGLWLPAMGFVLGLNAKRLVEDPRMHPHSQLQAVGELWHLHLTGSPAAMGFANGRLTSELIDRTEGELYEQLVELVPTFFARHLVLGLVSLNNRSLPQHITEAEAEEIAGLARGYAAAGDPHQSVGPTASRLLHYHALHDASHYLIDNPLVNAPAIGCTAVAVQGARSAEGRLLLGRLFDFEGGRSFDQDKVVVTVAPDEGYKFLSVSWAGVAGVVTGMNEAGLWLSINAGASSGSARIGRPVILAVREALQHAATIAEAEAIITRAPLFVSSAILIASRRDNAAAVLEIGPDGHALRPIQDGALSVTNHFLHPQWQDDVVNQQRQREGTSVARRARAEKLLARQQQHDPASLLAILRDRRGVGDEDRGFGHRATINAWIGAHLVIADVSAGIVWVAEPEHGLGRLRAFDVHGPRPDISDLPEAADAAVQAQSQAAWQDALRRATTQSGPAAVAAARQAIALNPQHYAAYAALAAAVDTVAEQRAALEQALARAPAYAASRRQLQARLEALP